MVLVFLAEGFEEVEALSVVDILRRAQIDVKTVSIRDRNVTGAHGITAVADCVWSDLEALLPVEMIVLPGGMPGTKNLLMHEPLIQLIKNTYDQGAYVAAICAAPLILDHLSLLNGKRYICYPGFESKRSEPIHCPSESVVQDEQLITGKGMGVSLQFSLKLVEILKDSNTAEALKNKMMVK